MKIRFRGWLVLLAAMLCLWAAPTLAEPAQMDGQIVIVHTNDTHSRVSDYMGFAAVKYWKDYYEQQGATVLLLDAGDTLHGLPIANLTKGEDIVTILNAVGYTAMTPGNHDFNYGVQRLLDLREEMDFDLLSCNLTAERSDEPVLTPSAVYGQVGVVGISTPETASKTDAKNVAGYTFNAARIVELVQAQIDALRADPAVKYVVALGHLGVDESSQPYRSTDLIAQLTGLDVFIDGHSHSTFADNNAVKDAQGKDVILTSAGEHLKNVGVVTLKDGKATSTILTEKDDAVHRDAAAQAQIDALQGALAPLLSARIGNTSVALNGERGGEGVQGNRNSETNLGDLVNDAQRALTGAEISLMNGGSIRVSLPADHSAGADNAIEGYAAGDISYGDLNSVFPFGNTVKVLKIDGQTLVDALEWGVRAYPELTGGFPQTGGLTFSVDTTAEPAVLTDEESGDFVGIAEGRAYAKNYRVYNVRIGGQPVDLSKQYTLAVNDYLAGGGDGYTMLADLPVAGEYGALDEAIITYIRDDLNGQIGENYAQTQNRMALTEGRQKPLYAAYWTACIVLFLAVGGGVYWLLRKKRPAAGK
ncbi:MAG: bifunctional UDP-sugar hydrolase/5'-nucleotidase [Eubacteriales bacterium]|nr:bifunctional UDP-sugar hydrolase/5'-nucleotidase [Eubacteriales bacterium]